MDEIVDRLNEEIGKFSDNLQYEKQQREETQMQMFRMIEDIHAKVSEELIRERREREESETSLV